MMSSKVFVVGWVDLRSTNLESRLDHFSQFKKLKGFRHMVQSEANWNNWKPDDFKYCLNVVTEVFGTNRLLFGSDWPVSLLVAS